jgi:hypothetical protein
MPAWGEPAELPVLVRPLPLALILLLPAAAALAGGAPAQVTIETRIAEVTRLDFDLGFKLGCDHTVDFAFGAPGILAAVNTPPLTRKQSFEFEVLGFGTTNVTANFTGAGGGCVGAGSDMLVVTVKPDLSAEVKLFARDAKALVRSGSALASQELTALDEDFGAILADYQNEVIDENEAAAELFGAASASLAYLAAQLTQDLSGYADGGSALLGTAGAISLPRAFRTGAKGSLWEGALEGASGTYSEFAIDAEQMLCDALGALEGVRANVRLQKRFGPFLVHGPRLATDPDDVILLPTGWLAAAAWKGPAGRGITGAGYGVAAGGPNGKVRVVGPGGRDETIEEPYEAAPRQNLLLWIRPTVIEPSISASAFTIEPAPGNWRLELRYGADANASDVVQITAP